MLGRIWCWIARVLDRLGLDKTEAFVTSSVHCWFLGAYGFSATKSAVIDLLRMPILLLRRARL